MANVDTNSCMKLCREIMLLVMELHGHRWYEPEAYAQMVAPDHPLMQTYRLQINRIFQNDNKSLLRSLTLFPIRANHLIDRFMQEASGIYAERGHTGQEFFVLSFKLCVLALTLHRDGNLFAPTFFIHYLSGMAKRYLRSQDIRIHRFGPASRNRDL